MKLSAFVLVSLLVPVTVCAVTPEQAAQQGQDAMIELGATLRTALKAVMKDGGSVNAIGV